MPLSPVFVLGRVIPITGGMVIGVPSGKRLTPQKPWRQPLVSPTNSEICATDVPASPSLLEFAALHSDLRPSSEARWGGVVSTITPQTLIAKCRECLSLSQPINYYVPLTMPQSVFSLFVLRLSAVSPTLCGGCLSIVSSSRLIVKHPHDR